jgi:hypothetical protein
MSDAFYAGGVETQPGRPPDSIGNYYAGMLVYEADVVHPGIVDRMSPQQLAQTALALVLTRDHLQATHGGRLLEPRRSALVASLVQADTIELAQQAHPGVPVSKFIIELEVTIRDLSVLRNQQDGRERLQDVMAKQLGLLSSAGVVAESVDRELDMPSQLQDIGRPPEPDPSSPTDPTEWPRASHLISEFGVGGVRTLLRNLVPYPRRDPDDVPYVKVAAGGPHGSYRVNPQAKAWLRASGNMPAQNSGSFVSIADMAQKRGMHKETLYGILGTLFITAEPRRTGQYNKKAMCITAAEENVVDAYIENERTPFDPIKDVAIIDIAEALGRHVVNVRESIKQHNSTLSPRRRRKPYPRRTAQGKTAHCLDPRQGCEVIGELGRLMPKRAVLTTELPAKLGLTAEEHGPYVDYLLKISPYRWKVVTKNVFEPDADIAWLEEADVEAFAEWAKGEQRGKSAVGILETLADLDAAEFGVLDKTLFDLQNSQGVQPDVASLITNATIITMPAESLARLDAVEIGVLMSLFLRHEKPATVAADLAKQERIKSPARPLVTNLSRYYAQQLDSFLVEALGKILQE